MQVIQHIDPAGHLIVARVPTAGSAAIQLGSQLIVEESQQAVMLRDGKALDTFPPGRHTLTTANLPLLTKLMGVPFGGTSPFQCAVLFVSTKTFLDLKWGTKEPVAYRDRELGLVRLRAFGKFAIKVADPQLFALQIVGTQDIYATDAIEAYLRDLIVSRLTDLLGDELDSILDLPGLYADLAAKLGGRVDEDFARYGITLEDLFVGAITPPKEVQEVIDEKAGMSVIGPDMATYLQFKAARAMGDAAQQEGGMGAGVGAGVGVGVGAGVGAMLPQMMKEAGAEQNQATSSPATANPAPDPATCPECSQALVGGARFCAFCGAPQA